MNSNMLVHSGLLWQGFFVPYLTGGISIAVLAVGSTAPGLLQFFIDKYASKLQKYHKETP